MDYIRRKLVSNMLGSVISLPIFSTHGQSHIDNSSYDVTKIIDWSQGGVPLFCIAYIDPGISSQKGQEKFVAKYPIALVPQDMRKHFVKWRDTVKSLNPDIKLLAYQMVIEETVVPGPGHELLSTINNSWVEYPGGIIPTVTYKSAPNKKRFRVFDPRESEWQNKFIEACLITLDSYPYDGLFLDQCTIYSIAALNPFTKNDMIQALDKTLHKLRKIVGDKLIIGNSSYNWNALNGEMNESRPSSLKKEIFHSDINYKPRMELFHYYMDHESDVESVRTMFELAIKNHAYFGASLNPQRVRWLSVFDEVLSEYKIFKL